jgi:flagellar biosynthesis/type III secretory pathway protein FliH
VDTAVSIGLAAVNAVMTLPAEQRLLYSALIEQALSEEARKAMAMDSQVERFFSDAQRQSFDRGKAEGEAKGEAKGRAEGEAKALLVILRRRGVAVTSDQQHRILACTDVAILDRWLDRAFSIASAEELFA